MITIDMCFAGTFSLFTKTCDVQIFSLMHLLGYWYIEIVISYNLFCAQSVHIKLASPQAAQLSLFFIIGKSVVFHLLE